MAKYLKINGKRQTKFDLMFLINQIDCYNACGILSIYNYDEYVDALRFLVEERASRVCNFLSIHLYRDLCKSFGLTPEF